MLVISNAMPKSASSLLFWYTQEIIQRAFPANAIRHMRELNKSDAFRGVGCFVNPLDDDSVLRLLKISKEVGPLCIKSHSSMSPLIESLIDSGEVIATFAHRDPRDMILSAIDHFYRRKAAGFIEFEGFTTVMESMDVACWFCEMACRWVESDKVHVFRYEDTITDKMTAIMRLRDIIGVEVNDATLTKIVHDDDASRSPGRNQFNLGKVTRFANEMTKQQLDRCNYVLGHYMQRLGYDVAAGQRAAA